MEPIQDDRCGHGVKTGDLCTVCDMVEIAMAEPIQDDIEKRIAELVAERQVCEAEHWDRAAVEGLVAERDAEVNKRVILETRKMEEAWLAERDRLKQRLDIAESAEAAVERIIELEDERDRLIQERDKATDLFDNIVTPLTKKVADLEAERDRLVAGIGALVEKLMPLSDSVSHMVVRELEALTKTTEEP